VASFVIRGFKSSPSAAVVSVDCRLVVVMG
jgi:hypothetical protein